MTYLLKFLPWIVMIVFGIVGIGILTQYFEQKNASEKLEEYNRQLSGQLTSQEVLMQSFNKELGLAQSDLITQRELNEKLAKDKFEVDKNFETFKKQHDLKIHSLSNTIASLQQQITDGQSSTTLTGECENLDKCIIGYAWKDPFNRFQLSDPNIFEQGNELFTSAQLFRIHIEVYAQTDGSLQTQRLVLREVYKDGSGNFKDIKDGKAEIVASSFDYVNPPILEKEFKFSDLFKIRPIILASIELYPETPDFRLGAGMVFFGYKGLMLNSYTSFDFDSINNITQNLGISYIPEFDGLDFNVGLGASIGTPFVSPFQEYSFQTNLVFYIFDY